MTRFSNLDGFVLVGGRSSRMGRDKALLELNGTTLLTRATMLLAPLTACVSLVGDPAQSGNLGVPCLADRWPGAGPLGGVATALGAARRPWSMVLACDMPYLTGDWLAWLAERANQSSQDVVIPETARGFEPLCAVYRSECAATLTAALGRGVRKITDALASLAMDRVPEKDWKQFSPEGLLFRNLNTWEDYLEARKHFTA
jgi:molybdenum cofactor guanylyltransferase